ncbi:MAG: ribonuclease HII [Candidatus Margulisiibacteriota bacterium]|nr:ribonuclease HII [Candidatus Margulisiibacteriota bacterium]
MNLSFERKLWKPGIKYVAGVDEVGRGPLAGPVVASAVIFPQDVKIRGLSDSKKVSSKVRERLYAEIKTKALAIGIGKVSYKIIDKINIWQANLLAMKQAVEALSIVPDFILIDGARHKIDLPIAQQAVPQGDARCFSIAAASIVAKITRDRIMQKYHRKYPKYRFDQHKGYGTKRHYEALGKFGPCGIHRRSFNLSSCRPGEEIEAPL